MATKKETVEIEEKVLRPATAEEGEYLANITPIDKVMIHLYKSENPESREAKDVFVSINGKSYQIKRGVDVEVPYNVALVLEQSAKMLSFANKYGRLKK